MPGQTTAVSDWKARSQAVELEVPSGKTCLARRVGMQPLLERGQVPDALTPIVEAAIRNKKGLPPEQAKEMAGDVNTVMSMNEFLDRACVAAMVEPKVEMPPGCEQCGTYNDYNDDGVHKPSHDNFHRFVQAERDDDVLYADEVDIQDKMFLFQWAIGGTAHLESFREQWQRAVELLAEGQDDGSPSE